MSNYNRVIQMGRLTRAPEARVTSGGTEVCSFGLAVNTWRKDKDDEVLFVDVTCWGRLSGTVVTYCSRGDLVQVEGRLRLETWEDKGGGGKRSKHTIVADRVIFLPSSSSDEAAASPAEGAPF